MTHWKPLPRLAFIAVLVALALYCMKVAADHFGYGILKTVTVAKVNMPDPKDAVVENVTPAPYPTSTPNGCQNPIRSEVWAWNSQMGWAYSNGGVDTTKGSLAEKYGACVHFNRQDDTGQMQNDLAACAQDLKNSTECANGVNFVTIMADGAGQFLAPLNARLKKICADCTAENEGTTGFSRGEDGLWGPESWKRNPRSALGDGLIAGVLRDGDWNTGQKWAGDNALKSNPDEHTFDPDALNWVNAGDYIKAAQMYISGYCEDRKVKDKDGKPTGETRNVCVKGVVTWTPGDVDIATQKGGIVRIASTKQYRSQMPSAVIGIKKWSRAHADQVAAMFAAAFAGGDQVKAFPEALKRAGDISAKIYGEQDGAYWVRYYKGVVERDATGKEVELGGSYADNLNDALNVFGLAQGTNNNVKSTYTTFAKIVTDQYGSLFKDDPIPPYEQVTTTAYILQAKGILDNQSSAADIPQYSPEADTSRVVSAKNVSIEFSTGSAALTANGVAQVMAIKEQAAITGLTIVLNGNTDNTGNPQQNRVLSKMRAESVKSALQQAAPNDFPDARFRVNGYGPDRPIADNSTTEGRAKNRRVEVILAE